MNKKIAVIMGSKSDYPVMKPAIDYLRKHGIRVDPRVTSAHRTPDLMASFSKSAQQKRYSAIIAGAGGAAHLPGMAASHTLLPVIGIPVKSSHYKGIDSLLSILQMPPGVSVLTTGISQAQVAGQIAKQILETTGEIHLCGNLRSKPSQNCIRILKFLKVKYSQSSKAQKEVINVNFVSSSKKIVAQKSLVINCFVGSPHTPQVTKLNAAIGKGVAVGMNNGVNAALSAIQIAALSGKHTKTLARFRKQQQQKAAQMDKIVRKK